MDIKTLANSIYFTGPELAGGALKEQLETLSREEFAQLMTQAHQRRVNRSETPQELLYAGSTQRAELSEAEIAVLANRYDPHSMTGEEYGNFLDDLVDMGAISKWEKLLLGCNGMLAQSGTEAVDAVDRESMKRDWEHYEVLSGILGRMEAMRPDQTDEDEERTELLRQLADPGSDFYTGILQTLQRKMEEREDQEREQAIIDALGSVLDAMSGKQDTERSDIPLSLSEIARQIGELDPQDPERVRLELFMQRINELGIYFDPADLTGGREEEPAFETLTQLLMRRQRDQVNSSQLQ